MIWLLALGSAAIVATPWFLARRVNDTAKVFLGAFVLSLFLFFVSTPSLVGPLLGGFGLITMILLVLSALVASFAGDSLPSVAFGIVAVMVYFFVGLYSSTNFRAAEYAALVGPIEVRDWSEDIQPKDPRHFRTSSEENAEFMARRAVGQATAGQSSQDQRQQSMSQFEIKRGISSVQIIKHELWTIVPLDWKGWGPWSSATPGIPGYLKVHGEDPVFPAKYVAVLKGREMKYTPEAFWHQNLGRLVWNAHPFKSIVDVHMEIDDGDDGGIPHFVVSLAVPTIGFWGHKVIGCVIVNPADGSGVEKFYPLGEEPAWVDRVMASHIVHNNIDYHGKYAGGWWNRTVTNTNINVATETHFGYGGNGEPVLATGIASHDTSTDSKGNKQDDSLLGIYYTNTRTGKTIEYRLAGGATEAICVRQVNQIPEVRQGGLHGTTPQIYNIQGHIAYVIPTQNASHAFAGVGICDIMNVQVAVWAKNAHDADLLFKQLLHSAGSQIGIEGAGGHAEVSGKVARTGQQLIGGETVFYFLIEGTPHLFTGPGKVSATIPVTQVGDSVVIEYIDSRQDVMAIYKFSNNSVGLTSSTLQEEVRGRAQARIDSVRVPVDEETRVNTLLDKLSPADRALLEKRFLKN